MSNSRSLRRLAIFLGTAASVAALPAQEKRAPQEVTATIDGVVVSWVNNYTPGAATPAAALTTAPAVPAPSGQDYITATINGQVVSWVNDYTPGAAAATTPAPAPAPTSAPAAPAGSSPIWVTATYDGATFSFIYTYVPVTTPAPAPPASTTTPILTQFPTPAPTLTPGEQCEDVHIFIAKGNNEPYPGRQGVLVDAICADLPSSVSCGYENIMYDNDLSDNYCTSVSQGDVNGKEQMTQYAANCPNAKLVLSGYSQGSNIVGDILGGGGGPFGHPQACTIDEFTGINPYTSPGNQLAAVLLFGNNRHVGNQVYNVLNGSAYDTDNPRYQIPNSLQNMNLFSDIIRDYCDESDPVCATEGPGPFVIDNHLNYFDRYTDDAAEWVAGKLGY